MSYRNDTDATYDRTLLSSVPDPTRAEKQEGYNVDLLEEESRDRRAPSPPVPNRQPTDQQPLTDGAAVAQPHKEGAVENGGEAAVTKGRWYRTRWGVTAIIIVIILIIGGIVGGVVGGTHHSSPKKNTDNAGGNPSPNSNNTVTGQISDNGGQTATSGGFGFTVGPTATGSKGGQPQQQPATTTQSATSIAQGQTLR